jgi:hypothetical protein
MTRRTAEPTTKLTVTLPSSLVEELRNTVVALSGPPYRLTLAAVVRRALAAELERLCDDRGGRSKGRSFPGRQEPLRAGRPIR